MTAVHLPTSARLSVSEIFGPTIQGEGPTQGRAVMFVRLGLCNLDCSWCDTPYTWDWTGKNGTKYDRENELVTMPVVDIVSQLLLEAGPVRRVVISGGEPFVQKKALTTLIVHLLDAGFDVEVETNGTISPPEELLRWTEPVAGLLRFNCSPKLANSGIDYDKRIDLEALKVIIDHGGCLKFVVNTERDLDEIDALLTELDCPPERVYLMPEGIHTDRILDALPGVMDIAATHGYNVSPRLHVLAYDNRRGI